MNRRFFQDRVAHVLCTAHFFGAKFAGGYANSTEPCEMCAHDPGPEAYSTALECEGHPDGPVMGETFYCDGTCQPRKPKRGSTSPTKAWHSRSSKELKSSNESPR